VKEFLEVPAVEHAIEQLRSEWSNRSGIGFNLRIFFENPNTKEALAFIKELTTTEVFFLADKNVSKWYEAQGKLNDDSRSRVLNTDESAEEKVGAMIKKAIELTDSLTVPTLVIGARCKDEDLALGKLDQLETVLQLGIGSSTSGALVLKNLDRIDDARGNRLQLRLDGTQIPWDSIPTNESFDEESKDLVQEALEKKSITITIGMLDGFFVLGFSPSGKALLELGKGKSLLEHPEMHSVREALSQPLTSVSFTSDALAKAAFEANLKNFFSRNLTTNIAPVIQPLEDNSEILDFIKEIVSDCYWLDETIAKMVPEFKGITSISYLIANGWERHDYSRTMDMVSDASSPLISLEHTGGNPMLLVASRLQDQTVFFQLCRKIVQKLKTRFDEAYELDWSPVIESASSIFPGLEGDSGDLIERLKEIRATTEMFWPYLVQVADTWEKKILPAITGEQAIIVSGGNLSAKKWFKDMPPSVDPLPLPEFASVIGIKNKPLLKEAFEDLYKICDDIVELIQEKYEDAVPANYEIPRPIKSDSSLGEKYSYAIPDDCPVPKEMMPQILYAGDYLIKNYSDKQSMSLAAVTKLSVGNGIIVSTSKQSSASYVDLGRIFEFARPWVRYALIEGMESMDDSL
ncbi:MAG TPA: hypothetical protein VM260_00575, partial [Pirellula sp.]|nr:hypothetical protein [Pirellula sp.]